MQFIFKFLNPFIIFILFSINISIASDYEDKKNEYFSDRKLDTLEGLWVKTFANQGPTGCVTMFYKTDANVFNQIHIDSCFVLNKVTGKHTKHSETIYNGKNAIYYYDGKIDWGQSKIEISEDYKFLSITHISPTNTFTEKWERIWPVDFSLYNNSLGSIK